MYDACNSEVSNQLAPNLNTAYGAVRDRLEINRVWLSPLPMPVSPSPGGTLKKRKNTERSVSPTYNGSRVIGFSPSTPISVAGLVPSSNPKVASTANSLPLRDEFWDLQNTLASPLTPAYTPPGRKHTCPYCNREFTRQHNLTSHLLIHSQEKLYVCQKCTMKLCGLHELKRHMKRRTSEQSHICPNCNRRFARGDELARHTNEGCRARRRASSEETMNRDALDPDTNYPNLASRPSSVSSRQSERGRGGFRDMFRRRSSEQVAASPGYEEIIFDSRSDRSGSQVSLHSNTSCASGRRGPLSEWARAGMKAVKAIGACWRCKL